MVYAYRVITIYLQYLDVSEGDILSESFEIRAYDGENMALLLGK